MSSPFRIVALHGFLGCPDDWAALRQRLPGARWSPLDLWAIIGRDEVRDWATMGIALEREVGEATGALPKLPTVVLAYSFGARLILAAPRAASRAIGTCLVSCNPGLGSDADADRAARRSSDDEWAQRLLEWAPQSLFEAWNRQPALASSAPLPVRCDFPTDRAILAKAMRAFSLAGQPDWSDRLRRWPGPLLVAAGARDEKYVAIARRFERAVPPLDVRVVERAGHRVPWDAPDEFAEVFTAWAEGLISRSRA